MKKYLLGLVVLSLIIAPSLAKASVLSDLMQQVSILQQKVRSLVIRVPAQQQLGTVFGIVPDSVKTLIYDKLNTDCPPPDAGKAVYASCVAQALRNSSGADASSFAFGDTVYIGARVRLEQGVGLGTGCFTRMTRPNASLKDIFTSFQQSGDDANDINIGSEILDQAGSYTFLTSCSGIQKTKTITVAAPPPAPTPSITVTLTRASLGLGPDINAIKIGNSVNVNWEISNLPQNQGYYCWNNSGLETVGQSVTGWNRGTSLPATNGKGTASVTIRKGALATGNNYSDPSGTTLGTRKFSVLCGKSLGNFDSTTIIGSATLAINPDAPANGATLVSQNSGSLVAGQPSTLVVKVQNTGNTTWIKKASGSGYEAGKYSLGYATQDDASKMIFGRGASRVSWSSVTTAGGTLISGQVEVKPQEIAIFNVPITAPATAGSYTMQWKMVQDNVQWFGSFPSQSVTVTAQTTPVIQCTSYTNYGWGACINHSQAKTYTKSPSNCDAMNSTTKPATPPTRTCYTVTAVKAGAGTGTILPASRIVTSNSHATFTISVPTNVVTFSGGCHGGTLSGTTYTTGIITDDCTVTANFTAIPSNYTITATAGTGGTITPSGATAYAQNSTPTYTIAPGTGFQIKTIKVGTIEYPLANPALSARTTVGMKGATLANCVAAPGGVCKLVFNSLTANQTIEVTFEAVPPRISVSAVGGGSITPNGLITSTINAVLDFTVSPNSNAGYGVDIVRFTPTNAMSDGQRDLTKNTANGKYQLTVTESGTVVARFKLNTYTITVTKAGNGAVTLGGTVVGATVSANHNDTKVFTITPNTGYTATVSGTCNGSPSGSQFVSYTYTTSPITKDCTVTATFTLVTHLINTSVHDETSTDAGIGKGGTISANPALTPVTNGSVTVNHGANISFTISPDDTHDVDNVYFVPSDSLREKTKMEPTIAGTYFLSATEAGTVYVKFKRITKKITVSVLGVSTSVSGTVAFPADSPLRRDSGGTDDYYTATFYKDTNSVPTYIITPGVNSRIKSITVDGAIHSSASALSSFTRGMIPATKANCDAVEGGCKIVFNPVTADHTIVVTFEAIPANAEHRITTNITPSAGGRIFITDDVTRNDLTSPVTVNNGGGLTFHSIENSGYTFGSITFTPNGSTTATPIPVYVSPAGSAGPVAGVYYNDLKNITQSGTVTATFVLIPVTTHTITVTQPANGTITASSALVGNKVTVNDGDNIAFTITPNAGYEISGNPTVTFTAAGGVTQTTNPGNKVYSYSRVKTDGTLMATLIPTTYKITTSWTGPGKFLVQETIPCSNGNSISQKSNEAKTYSIIPTKDNYIVNYSITQKGANGGYQTLCSVDNSTRVQTDLDSNDSFTCTPITTMGSSADVTITNPVADMAINATFVKIPVTTYDITVIQGVGGTITPANGSTITDIPLSEQRSFIVAPDSTHVIEDITINGGRSTAYEGSSVAVNAYVGYHSAGATITATFKVIPEASPVVTVPASIIVPAGFTIAWSPTSYFGALTDNVKIYICPSSPFSATACRLAVSGGSLTNTGSYTLASSRGMTASEHYIYVQGQTKTDSVGALVGKMSNSFTVTPNTHKIIAISEGAGTYDGFMKTLPTPAEQVVGSKTYPVTNGDPISFTVAPSVNSIATIYFDGGVTPIVTAENWAKTYSATDMADHTIRVVFSLKTYTITVTQPANGKITLLDSSTVAVTSVPVVPTGTKDFFIIPNAGYGIEKVEGCNGALTRRTGGEYSYYTTGGATENCTITATLSLPIASAPNLNSLNGWLVEGVMRTLTWNKNAFGGSPVEIGMCPTLATGYTNGCFVSYASRADGKPTADANRLSLEIGLPQGLIDKIKAEGGQEWKVYVRKAGSPNDTTGAGFTSSVSMQRPVNRVNASCGPNQRLSNDPYPASTVNYPGRDFKDFCASGELREEEVAFPVLNPVGGAPSTAGWNCDGFDGGTSYYCQAYRNPATVTDTVTVIVTANGAGYVMPTSDDTISIKPGNTRIFTINGNDPQTTKFWVKPGAGYDASIVVNDGHANDYSGDKEFDLQYMHSSGNVTFKVTFVANGTLPPPSGGIQVGQKVTLAASGELIGYLNGDNGKWLKYYSPPIPQGYGHAIDKTVFTVQGGNEILSKKYFKLKCDNGNMVKANSNYPSILNCSNDGREINFCAMGSDFGVPCTITPNELYDGQGLLWAPPNLTTSFNGSLPGDDAWAGNLRLNRLEVGAKPASLVFNKVGDWRPEVQTFSATQNGNNIEYRWKTATSISPSGDPLICTINQNNKYYQSDFTKSNQSTTETLGDVTNDQFKSVVGPCKAGFVSWDFWTNFDDQACAIDASISCASGGLTSNPISAQYNLYLINKY